MKKLLKILDNIDYSLSKILESKEDEDEPDTGNVSEFPTPSNEPFYIAIEIPGTTPLSFINRFSGAYPLDGTIALVKHSRFPGVYQLEHYKGLDPIYIPRAFCAKVYNIGEIPSFSKKT